MEAHLEQKGPETPNGFVSTGQSKRGGNHHHPPANQLLRKESLSLRNAYRGENMQMSEQEYLDRDLLCLSP